MSEMEAIVNEFLAESNENLDQLDRDLVDLELNPGSRELLARVFRTVHSIKGATGFLGFTKLGAVAHAGESLLSSLRDGVLVLNPEITSGLLSLVDAIRKMLSEIGETGHEGEADHTALIDSLTKLQKGALAGKDPPPPGTLVPAIPASSADHEEAGGFSSSPPVVPSAAGVATGPGRTAEPGETPREPKESSPLVHSGGSLRVDVQQLDKLMNLVGELVLTRNRILQISSRRQDPALLVTSQQLSLLTSELQEGIAKVRMQPIDNIWHMFPRLLRDLTVQCGKQARLEMEGKDTELDKAVIEAIKDPLTHLVRNAVDHGI